MRTELVKRWWQLKWMFLKIGVPQNGWFTMETPIRMDDLRVPLFFGNTQVLFIFTPNLGEMMIHFDLRIFFRMGW